MKKSPVHDERPAAGQDEITRFVCNPFLDKHDDGDFPYEADSLRADIRERLNYHLERVPPGSREAVYEEVFFDGATLGRDDMPTPRPKARQEAAQPPRISPKTTRSFAVGAIAGAIGMLLANVIYQKVSSSPDIPSVIQSAHADVPPDCPMIKPIAEPIVTPLPLAPSMPSAEK